MKKLSFLGWILIFAFSSAPFIVHADYSWNQTNPVGDSSTHAWEALAISADGNVVIAGINNFSARLYLSKDGGVSWEETQPLGDVNAAWGTVAINGDGSVILAGAYNGRLYISTDSGDSWSETQPGGAASWKWVASSISSDGNTMLVGIDTGRLYISTNAGTSWSETQPAGATNKTWFGAYVSGDGAVILAGAYNGRLYISTDSGDSWNETQPAGNVNQGWFGISGSADGSSLVVSSDTSGGGKIYISTDSGDSWTETKPAGNVTKDWYGLASSSDGETIIAGAYPGRVYFTTNGGDTWAETQPKGAANGNWYHITLSGDGAVGLLGESLGKLFVSFIPDSTPPTVSAYAPLDNSTEVDLDTNLVMTFDEDVSIGTGNITIYREPNDRVVEMIDVTSGQVTGGGTDIITVNLSSELDKNKTYYILIDGTAFDDLNGNSFAGIADSATWNFASKKGTITLGSYGGSNAPIFTPPPIPPASNLNAHPNSGALHLVPSTILTVKHGTKGDSCKIWQLFLNDHEANLAVDGICGKLTIAAAKLWQSSVGLVPDGILGPLSKAKAGE